LSYRKLGWLPKQHLLATRTQLTRNFLARKVCAGAGVQADPTHPGWA